VCEVYFRTVITQFNEICFIPPPQASPTQNLSFSQGHFEFLRLPLVEIYNFWLLYAFIVATDVFCC